MKKIAITVVVLSIVSVGMLSGCINPLDPKEQFIGTWEMTSVEPISNSPTDFQVLFIFYRNGTLDVKYCINGVPIESDSGFYQVESTITIELTMGGSTHTAIYNFPDTHTLTLLFGDILYTFNKVS